MSCATCDYNTATVMMAGRFFIYCSWDCRYKEKVPTSESESCLRDTSKQEGDQHE